MTEHHRLVTQRKKRALFRTLLDLTRHDEVADPRKRPFMGPRGFWIALAIVLCYLIARPHVGIVWRIHSYRPSPPSASYPNIRECWDDRGRYDRANGLTGTYCASEYTLLWGW
jgi:hypothetical protein